ncbi:MAG: AMP-binding protein, partial [Ramlibacter sp.]
MAVAQPSSQTLAGVLARHAAQRPRAVAVQFGGHNLPYGALLARSQAVAALAWHGWGVRPGDRVAWLGHNHVEQLVLLFALARIGALLLPLNVRLAPAEWDGQVADCGPLQLVHDAALAEAAQALARRAGLAAHPVEELADAPAAGPAAPGHGRAQAPVLLVFTSGTTSRPKAAVHTQANLLANMAAAARVQAMTPEDTVLTVLPLFHVGGLCIQTLPALWAGARVLLHPRFDAVATLDALARQRPSLTLQVPATMKALIEQPQWSAA